MIDEQSVPAGSTLRGVDLADLENELDLVRKKHRHNIFWSVIGLTPGAVIPFAGLSSGMKRMGTQE